MGGKLTSSIKGHPIASVALGAGAGLLLVEGVRRAVGGTLGSPEKSHPEATDRQDSNSDERDGGVKGSQQDQSDSDDDSQEEDGSDDDEDEAGPEARGADDDSAAAGSDDADRNGTRGIIRSATNGFRQGKQIAASGWEQYPLAICAAALGLGVLTGMLLPTTAVEDSAMGKASDDLAGAIKSAGGTIAKLASKAYEEAANAAISEAERAGLTPDHLGRKVKRLAVKVRDAVADAVQE
jgi:hypothetical protein